MAVLRLKYPATYQFKDKTFVQGVRVNVVDVNDSEYLLSTGHFVEDTNVVRTGFVIGANKKADTEDKRALPAAFSNKQDMQKWVESQAPEFPYDSKKTYKVLYAELQEFVAANADKEEAPADDGKPADDTSTAGAITI